MLLVRYRHSFGSHVALKRPCRSFNLLHCRRIASVTTSEAWTRDSVDVPIGLNRSVNLDVLTPSDQSLRRNGPRNVLVHFPPGPTIPAARAFSFDQSSVLQSVLPQSSSLVKINYKLGESLDSVFPTPVHEVATALDYLTSSTSPFNYHYDEPPKICLLGSHIGAALAIMLALTEPISIHALAVVEPMADWVGLDEVVEQLQAAAFTAQLQVAASPARRQTQRGKTVNRFGTDNQSVLAAAEELIKLRSKLFKTPSAYFDPFASPVLFLRAPGRDTPLSRTLGDPLAGDMGLHAVNGGYDGSDSDAFGPYDDDWPHSSPSNATTPLGAMDSTRITSPGGIDADANVEPEPLSPRRRKVLRRWPAVGFPDDVVLPQVRVFVQREPVAPEDAEIDIQNLVRGHAALMRAQGMEISELMRRACFIGREKGFAEERVQLESCASPRAEDMHRDAISWVAGKLGEDPD